ncbi:undecaprenyldiphospho-muramoylpentapeptide beta-N-acetylglucosaminyltransferase [Oleidesulfovibrio sp.]|uniref:undecaprenyldiphospho-muramoylpentapeptide beta-N-acetylglucosaminyltransferase n=1 Tax=Oleidesulfovibrio sp. TaxID=2909707 RepID=UPI003A849A49
MKRVLLTTGGTGGHIFPALAVAEEIARQYPEAEILFVGGQYGPESEIVQAHGIRFESLPVRGVLGRGLKAPLALAAMAYGVIKGIGLVGRFNPDVVIGFGGYAAFAAVLAAKLREKPCAIHEQNSVPGMANRLLAKIVDRIFISFPDPDEFFLQRKTVLTGNPVRKDIAAVAGRRKNADRTTSRRLLVMGGSLGARAINQAVVAMLPALKEAGAEIVHQTGKADFETVQKAYAEAGMAARVEPFVSNMAELYDWADLALCRAGATSVFELAAAGVPAVFVPFPFATHDHQTANAKYLSEKGAALLVPQTELAATDEGALTLARTIIDLLADAERLQSMATATRKLARPEAAAAIVSGAKDLIRKKPLKSLVPEREGE